MQVKEKISSATEEKKNTWNQIKRTKKIRFLFCCCGNCNLVACLSTVLRLRFYMLCFVLRQIFTIQFLKRWKERKNLLMYKSLSHSHFIFLHNRFFFNGVSFVMVLLYFQSSCMFLLASIFDEFFFFFCSNDSDWCVQSA